jgi:hypothetical protein
VLADGNPRPRLQIEPGSPKFGFNDQYLGHVKSGVGGYWVMKVFRGLGTLSLAPLALAESTL